MTAVRWGWSWLWGFGGAELGVIYFRTNWGAKEPQNLTNHGVVVIVFETKKSSGKTIHPQQFSDWFT